MNFKPFLSYTEPKSVFAKNKDHHMVAEWLMNLHTILTIGEEKKEIYIYEDGYYKPDGENKIKKILQEQIGEVAKSYDINEIIKHIQRKTWQERTCLDAVKKNFVCFQNGILDLNNMELLEHKKSAMFTQQIPYNYVETAECPKFLKFTKEVLQEKDIPKLQEFMGFCFYRDYSFKKASIFVGEKHTGKTTMLKVLINLIGEQNCSSESLHQITQDKFATSSLYNKLMNYNDDLSFEDIRTTGQFKIVTGGGYVSAQKKFGNSFAFKNYAKLVFCTNKISSIKDPDDDAYYDRWLIFSFNNSFEDGKANPNLTEELLMEIEGICIWALQGLKRLLNQGYFTNQRSSEENKLIMERSNNTVSAFIQDCLEEKTGAWLSKQDMYLAYSNYINNLGGAKVSKDKFGRVFPLRATYCTESHKFLENANNKKRHIRTWSNVKIKDCHITTILPLKKEVIN